MSPAPMFQAALRRATGAIGTTPSPLRSGGPMAPSALRRLVLPAMQQPGRWWAGSGEQREDGPGSAWPAKARLPAALKPKPRESVDPSQLAMGEKPIVDLMQNYIWQKHEIEERLLDLRQHQPESFSDKCAHRAMYSLYKGFNWITGYQPENTPVRAIEWRLIVLESFAGVPGFMAAMFRHFRSLRLLKRDHGWIHTLLEEAENERMHLLVCMKMFKAGYITRLLVLAAQVFMTPWLGLLYVVHPRSVHRFVGYLEETACLTYANIIHQVQTPGTPLNEAWADLPAPALAKIYWKLPEDAMWVDALKCMFADESNHRDVNHTFATMESDDPNPFVNKHLNNAVHAWRLEAGGSKTDIGDFETLGTKEADQAAVALNCDATR
mmetsp:Transcript_67254/g.194693  ORF Transcript_67254/g.194693 Transcript_67254/m.194693 type:complete len:381 (+) Transcript_67254:78-1220(+)